MSTQIKSTTALQQYGEKIAKLFNENNWEEFVKKIHPVNLPEGWQAMIRPLYEDAFGRTLKVAVIDYDDLPEHQLYWLNQAPQHILANTQKGIRLSYDHSTGGKVNTGKWEFAVYNHKGDFRILLVGGK